MGVERFDAEVKEKKAMLMWRLKRTQHPTRVSPLMLYFRLKLYVLYFLY